MSSVGGMNSIEAMVDRCPELQSCADEVNAAYDILLSCFRAGNKLLLCGNGGSCADCEHIAGELVKSFSRERPLDPELAEKLGPELATNLHGSLPAIPLPRDAGMIMILDGEHIPDALMTTIEANILQVLPPDKRRLYESYKATGFALNQARRFAM